LFRLAAFEITNITFLLKSYLNEEVNRIEPFPSFSVPWFVTDKHYSRPFGLYFENLF
jgi:hypothetical protein